MFFSVLNHHLRRAVSIRPVIFMSHPQIITGGFNNSYCHSHNYNHQHKPFTSTQSSLRVSNFSCFRVGQGNAELQKNTSFSSSRKYSLLIKDLGYNNTRNSFLPSLASSSFCNSKFVTLTNAHLCHKDNKTKSLITSQSQQITDSLYLTRENHHLSRTHQRPLLTQKLQGFPHTVLETPTGNILQKRAAVNVPKLILDASPGSWQPYLQLIRFDKPIGTWLLYWPCTWSIALAAQPGCWPDFYLVALFGAGAFFMRGAGCIINDMWDKDFDVKVERTRERPLACDRVTYPQAFVFLASQLGISLAILLQLNWYSIALGVASMGIVITYPTFKRFTYWPQVILGFAFNYGALMGWAAVRGGCDWSICIPLYFMCHMWTMVYDTIYAHQDKSDDILVGVKSTALRFGDQTKPWLAGFTAAMAGGLMYVGHITDMTWPYYTGSSIAIASIVMQLYRLNIDDPQACGDAFRFHFYIGLLMFVSIMLGNRLKPVKDEEKKEEVAMTGLMSGI